MHTHPALTNIPSSFAETISEQFKVFLHMYTVAEQKFKISNAKVRLINTAASTTSRRMQ
jgi:hypothetical protein